MEEENKSIKKRVKWDEEKLKQTQKTRGTFQKIDQPKTPYRKNEASDEDQMEAEDKSHEELALEESLYKAKMNSQSHHKKINIVELNAKLKQELEQYHGDNEEMMDQEQEEKRKRQQEFKKKRAQHYNEFQLIQKMKHQRWQDQDQDY